MKLVHKETGKEVERGEVVTSFRGEKYTVTGWQPPHNINSTGRIYVGDDNRAERGFFPSVFNCEWRD